MDRTTLNHPRRREVLAGMGAAAAAPAIAAAAAGIHRPRPGEPGWPGAEAWAELSREVGGRLAPVTLPNLDPAEAQRLLSNPYFLRDQAGLTQSSGWLDAWRSAPSAYVLRAKDAADVSAAVRFAASRRLRLVVKGGGHSYLGGSNAADSLLVWTRDMEAITLHDAFSPRGSRAEATPAVSVGAGCDWGHVYDAVTTKGGRYVQGGGCTTVGVAGLVQGGGFGSFSKRYGLAAAGLLEAEIVTADGTIRTVNAAKDADLFWALKGGGGGTYGVVTRLTLSTHELPATFGAVHWSLRARSEGAFHQLLARFVDLYAERLFNPHWGEQVSARPGYRFEALMLFQGLDTAAAREAWLPLSEFVAAHPGDYEVDAPILAGAFPAQRFWDQTFLRQYLPAFVAADERPGARPGDWWWAGNTGEAGAFWHGYQSLWLPASLLKPEGREALAQAWLAASRRWSTTFHFNKGLAGAPADVIEAARRTAMNRQVADAFALAIVAMDGPSVFAPLPPTDLAAARGDAANIAAAMAELRRIAPNAGSYLSESDYALANWREAAWGEHWDRLAAIKDRYDPEGLFVVHHGVGSHRWSADGFTRMA
jgi:FAD/FMN-containing dehydrogenase